MKRLFIAVLMMALLSSAIGAANADADFSGMNLDVHLMMLDFISVVSRLEDNLRDESLWLNDHTVAKEGARLGMKRMSR